MMFLFNSLGSLNMSDIILYGTFIFIMVFAFTSQMDGTPLGLLGEVVKFSLGWMLMAMQGGSWFGIESMILNGTTLVQVYLILSLVLSMYFFWLDKPMPVFRKVDWVPSL